MGGNTVKRELSGEIGVVIGASSGIGKATSKQLAHRGAHVVLVARNSEPLHEVCREIQSEQGEATVWPGDVSIAADMWHLASGIRDRFGRADVVVYSAGLLHLAPVEIMSLTLARKAMDVNYWGAVHTVQALLPLVRHSRRRSLVFLSSLSVPCTPAFFTTYAATKYSLLGMVKSLRQELAHEGIHVSTVTPGPVDTPLVEGYLNGAMYRLPTGIPVISPEAAARGVLRAVLRHKRDVVVPRRLRLAATLSSISPSLLEWYYHLTVPGWNTLVSTEIERLRRVVEDAKSDESCDPQRYDTPTPSEPED